MSDLTLVPFDFDQHPVRAVADADGSAWFVGKDVCDALGYTNSTKALDDHCRGVTRRYPIPDALGRIQQTRLIAEPDLYRLVVGSRLPAAERFERWVFEEVLPAIRRTGGYFSRPAAADMRGVSTAFWLIPPAVRAARALGLPREVAIEAANRTIASLTGVDAMLMLGIEPPQAALPETRPEAEFLLAWQNGAVTLAGGTPLPFVPCTGRQLYTAFTAWCWQRGIARPTPEGQFIGWVGSKPGWLAGRSRATRETPGSTRFKNRKMIVPPPDLLTTPDNIGTADWLTEGYFTFQVALDATTVH